jgi:hypothetical protein
VITVSFFFLHKVPPLLFLCNLQVREVIKAHIRLGRQREVEREQARAAGRVISAVQKRDEAEADAALAAVRKYGKLALTGLAR